MITENLPGITIISYDHSINFQNNCVDFKYIHNFINKILSSILKYISRYHLYYSIYVYISETLIYEIYKK